MADEQLAEQLMNEAFECLESFDTEGAIKIGERLRKMRFSGGYEVLARAYQQDGNSSKAIKVLQEGLKQTPEVWLLWQLLGNIQSDESQYADALYSYDQAAKCPGADLSYIDLNKAIVHYRQDDPESALSILNSIESEEVAEEAIPLRVSVLNRLKRFDEAISLARRCIELVEESEDPYEYATETASLYSELAAAYKQLGEDKELVLQNIEKAIEYDRSHEFAMSMLRELMNDRSDKARNWRVVLEGRWSEPIDDDDDIPPGFYVQYQVVADSPEEALKLAARFEPEEVRSSLRVEDARDEGAASDLLKGVYWTSGHAFFPWED